MSKRSGLLIAQLQSDYYGSSRSLLRHYLSVFIDRGGNLNGSRDAVLERQKWAKSFPAAVCWLSPAINLARLCEKASRGCYRQFLPLEYEIYTPGSAGQRMKFVQNAVRFRWRPGGERRE